VLLSITLITYNEEKNIGPTLDSVAPLVRALGAEVIIVDSGSTDRTVEIARAHGAKVFVEQWKGYGAQKNSAIAKAGGDWILALDADEMVSPELAQEVSNLLHTPATLGSAGGWCLTLPPPPAQPAGYFMPRQNFFLNRWIKHGGFWPDRKLRLFRRGAGQFEERPVHETVKITGPTGTLTGALIHNAYPTLEVFLEHMDRYSSLAAEMIAAKTRQPWPVSYFNGVLRPRINFIYNYVFRLGFLDGREGWLLHRHHMKYVAWKYRKARELVSKT
jgi:glycosyltransferase involved in cell wall biosynthesis